MEPTIKQLQDTIAQLNEALENWDYVVAQHGCPVQLPITKKMVHANRALKQGRTRIAKAYMLGYMGQCGL
ncbi:hypothetical protein YZ2_45 [Acinetobacter phage YZ2]|uniref:Uncharacterized protein n=1 Tax=Acinetobacter phage YZ2 TaxID=3092555 RepID=A0AAF0Z2R2_9CAUD|nr:hypothetical protein YZ2_45 [Acinetobacter phage YZ2]